MASGVVDVVAAECERLVDFPWIVRGDGHAADVMDVEVFQSDEFGEVVAFFPIRMAASPPVISRSLRIKYWQPARLRLFWRASGRLKMTLAPVAARIVIGFVAVPRWVI